MCLNFRSQNGPNVSKWNKVPIYDLLNVDQRRLAFVLSIGKLSFTNNHYRTSSLHGHWYVGIQLPKTGLKDFGNVADVTATFCVRGSFETSIKKSPTEQCQIEIYRNREQSEETSKSSFENSVQHNPTACTFTQKLPTMAWVAQLFKGKIHQTSHSRKPLCWHTCLQSVCFSILLPLRSPPNKITTLNPWFKEGYSGELIDKPRTLVRVSHLNLLTFKCGTERNSAQ